MEDYGKQSWNGTSRGSPRYFLGENWRVMRDQARSSLDHFRNKFSPVYLNTEGGEILKRHNQF